MTPSTCPGSAQFERFPKSNKTNKQRNLMYRFFFVAVFYAIHTNCRSSALVLAMEDFEIFRALEATDDRIIIFCIIRPCSIWRSLMLWLQACLHPHKATAGGSSPSRGSAKLD